MNWLKENWFKVSILILILGAIFYWFSTAGDVSPYDENTLENDIEKLDIGLNTVELATENCERLSLRIGLSKEQITDVELGTYGCNQVFFLDSARRIIVEPELQSIKSLYLDIVNDFEKYSTVMLFNFDPTLSSGELDRRYQTEQMRKRIIQNISLARDQLVETVRKYNLDVDIIGL